MRNPDVLIVGAGPTGLTLANLLAMSGVDFMIIDSKEKPSQDSKAFGIHARSLEVFGQLGIADKFIAEGNVDNTFHILSREHEMARFKLSTILPGETPYPYFLILPQDKTENILVDALNKKDQSVQWKHQLVNLTNTDQTFSAEIKEENGNHHHIYPRYIIGCDGADSTVRKKAGISFKGKSFTSAFLLADVELDTLLIHGDVYFAIAPNHLSVIFSYKKNDHYRVFNFINSALDKRKKEKLTTAEIQQILDDNPSFHARVKSKQWSSVYNIHCRVSEKFVKGNVLLAGDAAHVHSPVGGQGMNTGIQDAFNLAWKIKWVIEHPSASKIIQSYHPERYPIARNLHYSTDKFFQLLVQKKYPIDLFRMYILPYAFRLLSHRIFLKVLFRRVSQIAIKYRNSSLSKNYGYTGLSFFSPKAGDRAPWVEVTFKKERRSIYEILDYRSFNLLLAGGPDEYGAVIKFLQKLVTLRLPMLKVYFFTEKENQLFYNIYGVKGTAMFLIRPDGHIGLRSGEVSINELKNYYNNLGVNV